MKCPKCGAEMQTGRIDLISIGGSGDRGFTVINWYPEAEYGKRSMTSVYKKNGQTIADTCTEEAEAWFCPDCKKVLAEFTTK